MSSLTTSAAIFDVDSIGPRSGVQRVARVEEATPSVEDEPTPADRSGPYYTPNAPFRSTLIEEGMGGTRLVIRGRVRAARSSTEGAIRYLAGAIVDVWQANDAGEYDNVGFTLRGRFLADADGHFRIETIVPGRYLDDDGYRPSHLHATITADGHVPVTTQLYFDGDPFNAADVGFKESLMLVPTAAVDGIEATFDFVLAACPPISRRDRN